MDQATFLRRVGANIRHARWASGLTQEEAASGALSYRYYQELERGERNLTVGTLLTLARRFKTTVAVLVDVDPGATEKARARFALPAHPPPKGRKPSGKVKTLTKKR